MNRWVAQLIALTYVGGMMAGATGCASGNPSEQAHKHSDQRLLNEQRLTQELAISNRQMKQQIEELESSVRNLRDQLARTDRDWLEVRDELLRMKIEKEQQRSSGRDRLSQTGKPDAGLDQLRERAQEAMRRMKDLLGQLQSALDQMSGKEPL